MTVVDIQSELRGALNSAERGFALAEHVEALLNNDDHVELDFSAVTRMTPSYANAFLMVLLERLTPGEVGCRIMMRNQEPNVEAALRKSRDRYMRGLRLSMQFQHT